MKFTNPKDLLLAAAEKMTEHGHAVGDFVIGKKICLNASIASAMGIAHEHIGEAVTSSKAMIDHVGEAGAKLFTETQEVLANHIRAGRGPAAEKSDTIEICRFNNHASYGESDSEKMAAVLTAAAQNHVVKETA